MGTGCLIELSALGWLLMAICGETVEISIGDGKTSRCCVMSASTHFCPAASPIFLLPGSEKGKLPAILGNLANLRFPNMGMWHVGANYFRVFVKLYEVWVGP